jgi:predicted dehydrogenase
VNEAKRDYALSGETASAGVPAPEFPYRPADPAPYRPPIGVIGCGGISEYHLKAYAGAGFPVVALCDIDGERAAARQREFFPDARVYRDYREVLRDDAIEVVDVVTHPAERVAIIEAALDAHKHVLSQKPFVVDLDVGERLAARAEERGCRLAVNQNGRWAPHFSYLRHAVAAGAVGEVLGVHFTLQWDHDWIATTPFDRVDHVILYDFAVHWFDMLHCLLPGRAALRLFASRRRSPAQTATPPLLAQACVEFEGAQATLVFDGAIRFGAQDRTCVSGTAGSLVSVGPNLSHQEVALYTAAGVARPELEGTWFREGFLGTMSELLCAIRDEREPVNSARSSLPGLASCFAACASAERGEPQVPGTVRRMPGK